MGISQSTYKHDQQEPVVQHGIFVRPALPTNILR